MKKALMIFLFVISLPVSAGGMENSKEYDYYSLLSHLLSINEDRHYYIDENGVRQYDELKAFKEIDTLYTRYVHRHLSTEKLTEEQSRVVMLISLYAANKNSAAINEYLASDLKPIFDRNRSVFISSMGSLPFLIPPTCNRLNAHFGFEGKNTDGKAEYVHELKANLTVGLSESQANQCLNEFKGGD